VNSDNISLLSCFRASQDHKIYHHQGEFMAKLKHSRWFSTLVLGLTFALYATAATQNKPTLLADADLTRVVPTSYYFQGQSAPTQMRNAAAVRFAPERFVIAGLVDTSGYSDEIRGKYEGFFITDSAIRIGGVRLGTGAYGFGFSSDGKVNLFDIGGKLVLTVRSRKDPELKRPRPLMMMMAADGVRLYHERDYVILAAK
jgi:hypothetical protein